MTQTCHTCLFLLPPSQICFRPSRQPGSPALLGPVRYKQHLNPTAGMFTGHLWAEPDTMSYCTFKLYLLHIESTFKGVQCPWNRKYDKASASGLLAGVAVILHGCCVAYVHEPAPPPTPPPLTRTTNPCLSLSLPLVSEHCGAYSPSRPPPRCTHLPACLQAAAIFNNPIMAASVRTQHSTLYSSLVGRTRCVGYLPHML